MTDFPYVWTWRWRTWQLPSVTARVPWFGDGVDRAGMRCQVVTRGGMNSALVRFADGSEFVTSRGGLRRAPEIATTTHCS
ncbi:hypothetical protein FHR83_006676 [Actinoplanes campanulatus]|uniref:Uncharacterized protein n=1 Tax=Actinoplanes campanulatus TaxID=113559 RepID=A0A7W5AMQ1_9ACTN|nr:hypothetical protein [Actinoplanes campanulatus]MBB3098970.1 hypothetical protein [Actinoplanes campanulatus]